MNSRHLIAPWRALKEGEIVLLIAVHDVVHKMYVLCMSQSSMGWQSQNHVSMESSLEKCFDAS